MADNQITEIEAERILQLTKWIDREIQWRQDENLNWIVRAPVQSIEQLPLEWYARYNPRTGYYSCILFWHQTNLRRLDVGKLHHNPDCQTVGRIHKHRWSDAARDHYAYEPDNMTQRDDMPAILSKFLAECNIELRASLRIPPINFQRGLGI